MHYKIQQCWGSLCHPRRIISGISLQTLVGYKVERKELTPGNGVCNRAVNYYMYVYAQ